MNYFIAINTEKEIPDEILGKIGKYKACKIYIAEEDMKLENVTKAGERSFGVLASDLFYKELKEFNER